MRIARGLTLSELASRVGISGQMLSKIENAQTSASHATVDALARGLEIPVASLFRAADHETQAVFSKAVHAPETVRRGSNLGHHYRLLGQLPRSQRPHPLVIGREAGHGLAQPAAGAGIEQGESGPGVASVLLPG